MKNQNNGINRVIMVLAKIIEVFMWIGSGMCAMLTIWSATGHIEKLHFLCSYNGESALLNGEGVSLAVLDAAGNPRPAAFVLFFLSTLFAMALMGMVARNLYLIFKTSAGQTRFSKGATPFQNDNIRMIREIGIFLLAMPVAQLIFSIISAAVLGPDAVENSVNFSNVLPGLVALALSRYFAVGMELQNEVDGLV